MKSINITQKTVMIHTVIVLIVCVVFGAMNMAQAGGFAIGLGIALCGAAVTAVIILLKNKASLTARGLILSVFQLILIIAASALRHELHGMFPLMTASIAIAAIYFDRRNLIIQIIMIDAASLLGFVFKDFFYGEADNSFLIKGLLGVNIASFLIIYLVKCCSTQIIAADSAKSETTDLLEQVRMQSEAAKRAAENQIGVVKQLADISLAVNNSSDRMLEIADSLNSSTAEQTSTIHEITEEIGELKEP